jgi:acyl-coenzyme A synthetase/AMP-(fatty) acid ligase
MTAAAASLVPGAPFNMAAYCLMTPAGRFPTKPGLIVVSDVASSAPAELWTFAELQRAVLRVAGALRAQGLGPGDRVMIRLDNTSAYAILFFGIIAAGCVALPASSQLTGEEAGFLLNDSGAAAIAVADHLPVDDMPADVIAWTPGMIARMIASGPAASYAATVADDPAFLIYTSGTTARPKGVLHAQRSAWGRRPMYAGWYGISADDRMLHAGAFNWTYTLGTGLADPWANSACAIVYTGEKDPALWPRLIRATGATLFAAVPGLMRQVLKYAKPGRDDMGALRHALIAGETPPSGLFEEWEGMTGRPLYEALGMSEISTYVSTGPLVPRKRGRLGKPQPGRRIAVLPTEGGSTPVPLGEEGLLAVHRSDPGLMLGYWKRPAEEAEVYRGEWFVGGDLASIDEEGYVAHLGRANDLMKALGYRVSPLEIEAVLAQHPDVAEVACAEVPVRDDVRVIGAFIVVKPGARADADDIQAHARAHLAAYKLPRQIVFVSELPRTANGKVRRSALSQQTANPTAASRV